MANSNYNSAPRHHIRNLETREFLHMSGKRITNNIAMAWTGTRLQADQAMIAAHDDGLNIDGFHSRRCNAFYLPQSREEITNKSLKGK